MASGLKEFKASLKEVRRLSVWAVGAGISAPFIVALFSVAPPPWPRAIASVTAILELVALIVVFQWFAHASRKRVNRMMRCAAVALAVGALLYLFAFNNYTFVSPTGERGVIGFVCTNEGREVYKEDCNVKSEQHLAAAEYTASRLWKTWSINVITNILTTLWLLCFCALSSIVGLFVVFQRRVDQKASQKSASKKGRVQASAAAEKAKGVPPVGQRK